MGVLYDFRCIPIHGAGVYVAECGVCVLCGQHTQQTHTNTHQKHTPHTLLLQLTSNHDDNVRCIVGRLACVAAFRQGLRERLDRSVGMSGPLLYWLLGLPRG